MTPKLIAHGAKETSSTGVITLKEAVVELTTQKVGVFLQGTLTHDEVHAALMMAVKRKTIGGSNIDLGVFGALEIIPPVGFTGDHLALNFNLFVPEQKDRPKG